MRCPKCGFISFDHLETCLKCNKDVSEVSSQVGGTTFNVEAPLFLKVQDSSDAIDMGGEGDFDDVDDGTGIVDPDLDVLVDDEGDEGIEFDSDLLDSDEDDEYSVSFDDDDMEDTGEEGLDIDLGQFGDFQDDDQETEDEIQIDLPDELADISDLTPPDPSEMPTSREPQVAALDGEGGSGELDLNFDMDELGEDFSLSSSDAEQQKSEVADFSIDDLGLPGKTGPSETVTDLNDGLDDMDADLDFELDLGGLSPPKE